VELIEILANLGIEAALGDADVSVHHVSRNRERAFGLFPANRGATLAIGGKDGRGHVLVSLSAILRWGRDGSRAERKAAEVSGILAGRRFKHEGRAGFVMAQNPVWLGMDERGVYEYVLDFDIYVEEKGAENGISCKQHQV